MWKPLPPAEEGPLERPPKEAPLERPPKVDPPLERPSALLAARGAISPAFTMLSTCC